MKNHAGLTGWQLVASVVFIIQGADRLLRPGGQGFSESVVYQNFTSPPQKKSCFSHTGGLLFITSQGERGF